MLKSISRLLIGGLVPMLLLTAAASPVLAAEGASLVIGRITDDPEKHEKRLRSMADYLAKQLAEYGVSSVGTVMVETEDEMAELMRAGRVDILSETPFMAIQLESEGVVDILMREWKKGVPEYHSVVIARKDSAVQSLADLAGRRVAFEDAGSTSGYLLPRNAIENAGLAMAELASPTAPVADGAAGYTFTGSETGVIAAIYRGTADAGAVSNLDWAEEDTVPEAMRAKLRVIYETKPVIRSVLMVNASIPAEVQEQIAVILEQMETTPEGREAMKKYSKVARYDRIEGDALKGLEEARRIWLRLHNRAS